MGSAGEDIGRQAGETAPARETGSQDGRSPADEEAAAGLEFHWGEAYTTGRDAAGTWRAGRRDGTGVPLTAATAEELHTAIRADYAASPVSRDFRAGDAG